MHPSPRLGFVRLCVAIIAFAAALSTGSLIAAPRAPWLSVTPVPNIDLYGVAFGNGLFVAVGDSGTILTSSDGANWTLRASAAPNLRLTAVTYGSNSFVAVGATIETTNHPVVWTSPGGTTWTPRDSGSLLLSGGNWLSGVTYGKGRFVAVGGIPSTNTVAVSSDGISWTLRDSGLSNTGLTPLSGVAYGNGVFVAVGADVTTSEDGLVWKPRDSSGWYRLYGVTYGRDRFVGVGPYSLVYSTDGTNWMLGGPFTGYYLNGVTYGDGNFVYVSGSGSSYSTDGTNWITQTGGGPGNAVAYGNNIFVAVNSGGTIYRTAENFRLSVQTAEPAQVTLTGLVPGNYRIEGRSSLSPASNWSALTTLTITNSPFTWTDWDSANLPTRFYRAVWLP
jgi:hypothetical protein